MARAMAAHGAAGILHLIRAARLMTTPLSIPNNLRAGAATGIATVHRRDARALVGAIHTLVARLQRAAEATTAHQQVPAAAHARMMIMMGRAHHARHANNGAAWVIWPAICRAS